MHMSLKEKKNYAGGYANVILGGKISLYSKEQVFLS